MATQCIFPAELICNILSHTDPRDIVRWRTVSKWFSSITYDVVLWQTLYTNAPFPRPPGPSPSQSTESLQRTLVKSAQLVQSWTTGPMRDVSSIDIHLEGKPSRPHKLIHGRWLVDCESERRFVLRDVNGEAETRTRQVLWEEESPVVASWDVFPMASVEEGLCVVYVLLGLPNKQWKLLEFRLNDQSGELYNSVAMDPPASEYVRRAELYGGKSPFLYIPGRPMYVIFDTRTRMFYELPEFRVVLDETLRKIDLSGSPVVYRVAFTNTHVITCCFRCGPSWDHRVVIQVFMLPPDGSPVENGNHVLRLTHEGVSDLHILDFEVLKPSVDPVTGATTVRLLDYCTRCCASQVTRIDLTLPKPSPAEVLPMAVEMQHVRFPGDPGALARRYGLHSFQYVDVSDNGHARGFCMASPGYYTLYPMENTYIMKFTIDTTQDQWVVACDKLSHAEWQHVDKTRIDKIMTFDGMRGRLCFSDHKNNETVVVVDIK